LAVDVGVLDSETRCLDSSFTCLYLSMRFFVSSSKEARVFSYTDGFFEISVEMVRLCRARGARAGVVGFFAAGVVLPAVLVLLGVDGVAATELGA
jgi:hypothetical protein